MLISLGGEMASQCLGLSSRRQFHFNRVKSDFKVVIPESLPLIVDCSGENSSDPESEWGRGVTR